MVRRLAARNDFVLATNLHYQHPNLLPTTSVVFNRLQWLRTQCDIDTPCHGTDEDCWLLKQTKNFNLILQHAQLEMKVVSPGHLGICELMNGPYFPHDSLKTLDVCLLLHRLLVRHHCIGTLHLSNPCETLCGMVADVFRVKSEGLRELKLSCLDMTSKTQDSLLMGISKLCSLQKLYISDINISHDVTESLLKMLNRQSLVSVSLINVGMTSCQAGKFLEAICTNHQRLHSVCIHHTIIDDVGLVALAKLLEKSDCVLHTLSLCNIVEFTNTSIFAALRVNKSVKIFEMNGCRLSRELGAQLMNALAFNDTIDTLNLRCSNVKTFTSHFANALFVNQTIRNVNLDYNFFDIDDVVQIAEVLKRNRTLETLGIESNIFGPIGHLILMTALVENKTLTDLNLGYVDANEEIYDFLKKSTVSHRLRFPCDFEIFEIITRDISLHNVTSIHVECVDSFKSTYLGNLFSAVHRNAGCLKTLHIEVDAHMDCHAAFQLCKLLKNTSTLKRASINTYYPSSLELVTILSGLCQNRSVTHFNMGCIYTKQIVTNAIVKVLKENVTLSYFGTISAPKDELHIIANGLRTNVVLTSLVICSDCDYMELFVINQLLRRNVALVSETVKFVLNPHERVITRSLAKVFELLQEKESFTKMLAECCAECHVESKTVLKNARNRMTQNFFAITGICKVLECRPPPRRRRKCLQIDALNYECLLKIWSYLKVTDIVV